MVNKYLFLGTKKVKLLWLLLVSSMMFGQNSTEIKLIEAKLGLKVPSDLKEIWEDDSFVKTHRFFWFRNFGELFFLTPNELTKMTRTTEVSSAMNELNKLYNQFKEGKISKEMEKDLGSKVSRDIVMLSKEHADEKVLVFATSSWREGFIDIYYKFDKEGKSVGVFLSDLDQGSLVPIFLGNNISDVFGDLEKLKKGFMERQQLENFIYEYTKEERITNFPTGIFPKRDLRDMVEEIVPDMIFFKNYMELEVDSKKKIISLYKEQGKEFDANEPELIGASGFSSFFLNINNENFNDGKAKRMFIVELPYSDICSVAFCTPLQARQLNDLGALRYDSNERAKKEFKFMNY